MPGRCRAARTARGSRRHRLAHRRERLGDRGTALSSRGSIVTAMPTWQQRQQDLAALGAAMGETALRSSSSSGLVIAVHVAPGLSSSPEFDVGRARLEPSRRSRCRPAMAAVLAAKGRATGYQSVATLLDLADRGVLARARAAAPTRRAHYELSQVAGKHDLADARARGAARSRSAAAATTVTLSQGARTPGARRAALLAARQRATWPRARPARSGSRQAVRDRLTVGVDRACSSPPASAAPASRRSSRVTTAGRSCCRSALVVSGLIGIVMAATTTPLSDAGLLQSGAVARLQALPEGRRRGAATNHRRLDRSSALDRLRDRAGARLPVGALPEEAIRTRRRRGSSPRRRGRRRGVRDIRRQPARPAAARDGGGGGAAGRRR